MGQSCENGRTVHAGSAGQGEPVGMGAPAGSGAAGMRIGEVATAAGVSTRALRYYEQHGLLRATRSPSGQRHYSPDAVERVRWIQALYQAGLSSSAIMGLGSCLQPGTATPVMLAQLRGERERLDAQVQQLSATRARLDELIALALDSMHPSAAPAAQAS